jgi:hypothetical protein
MALDDLKEKLKSKLHRSNHRRSTSTTESNSQAPNRSSVASDRPAHDRLSHDHNVGCMFAPQSSFTLGKSLTSAATTTKSKPPVAPATPVSNYTSSRQSSISSLDNNSRPGLHNIDNTGYKSRDLLLAPSKLHKMAKVLTAESQPSLTKDTTAKT